MCGSLLDAQQAVKAILNCVVVFYFPSQIEKKVEQCLVKFRHQTLNWKPCIVCIDEMLIKCLTNDMNWSLVWIIRRVLFKQFFCFVKRHVSSRIIKILLLRLRIWIGLLKAPESAPQFFHEPHQLEEFQSLLSVGKVLGVEAVWSTPSISVWLHFRCERNSESDQRTVNAQYFSIAERLINRI